jgi:hypothetical protein
MLLVITCLTTCSCASCGVVCDGAVVDMNDIADVRPCLIDHFAESDDTRFHTGSP